MRRSISTAVLAAAAMTWATSARADCEIRALSAAETQYYARVTAALKAALPAAPQGWTLVPAKNEPEPSACDTDPQGRFEIEVRADYRYQPSKEEAAAVETERKALRKRIEALDVLPAEVVKERQAWLDKMSVANRAENEARKKGDKALASKMSDESELYSRKGREVRERYRASVRPQVEALEARIEALNQGLASVAARLAANELFPHAPEPASGSQLTAGKVPAPRTGGLQVHGVRLLLEGPASRRAIIEAAVDRKKLESLVR